ncbi:MAG: metal-dependent hydrolase [Anaerolineae bacterium]|jgi:L-ascorbate metabolism protein UlaG (beta-lactamase superfamily)|nr:metal-dependent hydrolase [Anaerolineae bacterium]
MELTWYGHATWKVRIGDTGIIIDPFFNHNPVSPVKAEDVDAQYIVLTHGHGDHMGDTDIIARRTGATIIANAEICTWLRQRGFERVHAQHIGGGFHHPFGYLKLTIAVHGSSLPDGSYGGMPAGVLISAEGKKIYHAGDTGLFASMALIGEEGLDVALLPIGDNYTMGPDDALRAVKLLQPRVAIPMHYETWELIAQDPHAWAERVRQETPTQPVVMQIGETYTVPG